MTKDEVRKVFASLRALIPSGAPDANEFIIAEWFDTLGSFDMDAMRKVYAQLRISHKFFPSLMEVFDLATEAQFGVSKATLVQVAVGQIEKAISTYGSYHESDAFESLGELARDILSGEDWQSVCSLTYQQLDYKKREWVKLGNALLPQRSAVYIAAQVARQEQLRLAAKPVVAALPRPEYSSDTRDEDYVVPAKNDTTLTKSAGLLQRLNDLKSEIEAARQQEKTGGINPLRALAIARGLMTAED